MKPSIITSLIHAKMFSPPIILTEIFEIIKPHCEWFVSNVSIIILEKKGKNSLNDHALRHSPYTEVLTIWISMWFTYKNRKNCFSINNFTCYIPVAICRQYIITFLSFWKSSKSDPKLLSFDKTRMKSTINYFSDLCKCVVSTYYSHVDHWNH